MKSLITEKLNPALSPVAIVWSDEKPEGALELTAGKFGCVMFLFANAAKNRKIAAMDRETVLCSGGRLGMGLGFTYDKFMGGMNQFTAMFSKGLPCARDKEAYEKIIEQAPKNLTEKLLKGERIKATPDMVEKWLLEEVPHYDIEERYVLFKPLDQVDENDNVKTIVFTVNPLMLSGLVSLTGFISHTPDFIHVPAGSFCKQVGCYAYAQQEEENPKAILGMTELTGRHRVRSLLGDNCLTYSIPIKLMRKMEKAAEDGVFESPVWKKLTK